MIKTISARIGKSSRNFPSSVPEIVIGMSENQYINKFTEIYCMEWKNLATY